MKYISAAGSQASEARTTIMNCVFSCQGLSPMNVRYLYAAIVLLANLSAWFARENTVSYYLKQRLSGCKGDRGCLAAESVLVASHAFFVSYTYY
jgi:serine incorporator 1/3